MEDANFIYLEKWQKPLVEKVSRKIPKQIKKFSMEDSKKRNVIIFIMREHGFTIKEIAECFNIGRQRTYDIYSSLKRFNKVRKHVPMNSIYYLDISTRSRSFLLWLGVKTIDEAKIKIPKEGNFKTKNYGKKTHEEIMRALEKEEKELI